MTTLRIRDQKPNRVLSFDIHDILAECTDYEDRSWLLWGVDWVAAPNNPFVEDGYFYTQCLQPFEDSPDEQVEMTFNELWHCANCVGQTEEGYFMALRPNLSHPIKLRVLLDFPTGPVNEPRATNEIRWTKMQQQLLEISDLVIQVLDFTFWEVTTEDEGLIQRLQSKFKVTEIQPHMMA